jgi:hypothetical protein
MSFKTNQSRLAEPQHLSDEVSTKSEAAALQNQKQIFNDKSFTDVFRLFIIDLRIPGMEQRNIVSMTESHSFCGTSTAPAALPVILTGLFDTATSSMSLFNLCFALLAVIVFTYISLKYIILPI